MPGLRTPCGRTLVVLAWPALLLSGPARAQTSASERDVFQMRLEELFQVTIVTASNTQERLADAPATVIVLTREELRARGYTELSQVLDDLPGMDVVRPYGDTYVRDYMRGFRNSIGEAFLLMVDGVVFNDLHYNSAEVALAAMPLSNVERIEVVYGPASSVYGANAFMGVINVITVKDKPATGSSTAVFLTGGSNRARTVDASYFYKNSGSDLRFSLTARLDDGRLDEESGERYEYTRNRYYSDRRLWGGLLDNPALGGRFRSSHQNRSFDLRGFLGDTELGVQYYRLASGYGLEYPGDVAQNDATWGRPEYSIHVRQTARLSPTVSSTSLVRYRRSDVSNDSYFVDGHVDLNPDSPFYRQFVAAVSYWQVLNSSWSAFQDFDVRLARLHLNAGLKYEQKDLHKTGDRAGQALDPAAPGAYLPAALLDAATYLYPEPPSNVLRRENRIRTEDLGVYVQARLPFTKLWSEDDTHQVNVGLRVDNNSQYGSATTVRAGYVGRYGKWSLKLLYGEAFQEPVPRALYAGWRGSGSDPDLEPEESRTVEVAGSRTGKRLSAFTTVYFINNRNTIFNVPGGARNLGERQVVGWDGHLRWQAPLAAPGRLTVWGYYSRILKATEDNLDAAGRIVSAVPIGDLAPTKLWLGVTAGPHDQLTATLRARYVGARTTVITNPIRRVGAFATVDATLTWRSAFVPGLGVQLTARNLLGTHYAHPGIRTADAGQTPGEFDAEGMWRGSTGYFNSLLPQPGRAILFSLQLDK
jgi:outer membrane receptor for ferrienterochelin and colicins